MKQIIIFIAIIITAFTLTVCRKSMNRDTISAETNGSSSSIAADVILPGNNVNESGITDISNHTGLFDVSMSGYKGELFLGIADGKFYGTIKFFNWGNGVPQPLNDLKVTEDKIYFKRIIKTKEDLIRYGGTAYFEQDFYGIFTLDKKTIKGYYRYIGTQDNWEALKK
ncbi:MAG TPA: hypothetical protein PKG60_04890 [Spirochaetota bacterium]|nr:hypothetical protein [Spirochaetota bacterium]HPS85211.1 hypothetical protein [Spirochaetota bacterium]